MSKFNILWNGLFQMMRTNDINDDISSNITWYILYRKLRSRKNRLFLFFVCSDLFVYLYMVSIDTGLSCFLAQGYLFLCQYSGRPSVIPSRTERDSEDPLRKIIYRVNKSYIHQIIVLNLYPGLQV